MIRSEKGFNITNDFLFFILIVFTVFDFKIVNISMAVLVLLSLIQFKKIKQFKTDTPSVLFGCFTLFILINGLSHGNFSEKRYGLLLLTFAIFFISKIATKTVFLLRCFVVSSFLIVVYGLFFIIQYYLAHGEINFTVGGHINQILYLERPYLGFLCIIASLVSLYLSTLEANVYRKYSMIFLMVIFIIYPFVFSARITIITYLFIGVIYFLFYLKKSFKFKSIIGASLILLFGIMFNINNSLKERFNILIKNEKNIELIKDKDPRMIIWPCAIEVSQQKDFDPFFGISSTRILTDKLVECYSRDTANLERRQFFMTSKFNTHNQYLDLYLTNGVIGLFLFIAFLLQTFFRYKNSFVLLAMWLAFACFCLTENILYRQTGFYMLILLVCFSNWIPLNRNDLKRS